MAHYPPEVNPRVVKVTLVFARDVRQSVNTFHVSKATPWLISEMSALRSVISAWYSASYKGILPTSVSLTQIQIRKLDPSDPLALDFNVTPAEAGTRGGGAEAANVSVTMSERTNFAGRAYRGRMYVPGVIQTDIASNDTILSGLSAGLAAAISTLISQLIAANFNLAVWHRPLLIAKPLDNTFTNVVAYVIENILDSQRRRLPGRGR